MAMDRTVTLSTRVTPKDEEEFKKYAAGMDMTLSDCLRSSMIVVMAYSGNRYGLKMLWRGTVATLAAKVRSMMGRPTSKRTEPC